ncbi:MAG: polyphosphate kinase, partial [Sphingomonadaceae bacterium]
MIADSGVRIVKLFLHTTQKEQDKRFIERLETPWKRWKMGEEDFRNRAQRKAYEEAYEEMFERTDTDFAPWELIGANNKGHARLAGLSHVCARIADGLDLTPPDLPPDFRALAERELGVVLRLD